MESIGERIKKIRLSIPLTQDEFGGRIGIARNTIAGYESGQRTVSTQSIELICREYHINKEWLLSGVGEMVVVDASDELEALADKYHLDSRSQIMVEKFVNLPESQRNVVIDYVMQVAAGISSIDEDEPSAPGSELEDLLHDELKIQKKAGDGSTSSGSSSAS